MLQGAMIYIISFVFHIDARPADLVKKVCAEMDTALGMTSGHLAARIQVHHGCEGDNPV